MVQTQYCIYNSENISHNPNVSIYSIYLFFQFFLILNFKAFFEVYMKDSLKFSNNFSIVL